MTKHPQPVVIQVVRNAVPRTYEDYHTRGAKVLGILQIVLGVLAVILAGIAIRFSEEDGVYPFAFLSAIVWIIAGAFGIASSCRKTTCTIVTTMVMSVLSTVFVAMCGSFAIAVIADASNELKEIDYDMTGCGCYEVSNEEDTTLTEEICVNCISPEETSRVNTARVSIWTLVLVLSLVELVVAIIASALCCRVACCCRKAAVHAHNTTNQSMLVNGTDGNMTVALPPGYQIVAPAQVGNMETKTVPDTPQYSVSPPPPYTTDGRY